MAFYQSIFNLLTASPTLTANLATSVAVGGGPAVWYGRAPAHQTMPYIAYWTPGQGEANYQAPVGVGVDYQEVLQLQVDVYAEDPDICGVIGNEAVALLDFCTPTIDANTVVVYCRRISPIDPFDLEPETSENALDVWHAFYLYEVMLQRTP